MNPSTGDTLDGWTLIEHLGHGGNAHVWRARHADLGKAALKVLSRKGGDRWQRFRDEIHVMRDLGNHPGVLPLLDSQLPDPGTPGRAWLATPIAERSDRALANAAFADVVAATHDFALTLATLATRGIHHRDVKPTNLFRYEGRWVLGDFGLVAYPGKEAITTGLRGLGPRFFIAPEMLRRPDSAPAGPADVYSLAKTLWVLASGEEYPPEGQIRVDTPEHGLARWSSAPGLLSLRVILEQATHVDPGPRPTMSEFAAALDRWGQAGAVQDDRAAEHLARRQVRALGAQLPTSLDPSVLAQLESDFASTMRDVRRRHDDWHREAMREAMRVGVAARSALVHDYGVKAALDLHDSPWVGSLLDGDDFVEAVMHLDIDRRQAELTRGRQIMWGRPLWWMHSVGLVGGLKLIGEHRCEPLAGEIARDWVRYHLLEFSDHPTLAEAWKLQLALILLNVRLLAQAPLEQMSQSLKSSVSGEEWARRPMDPSRIFTLGVRRIVSAQLRQYPWSPDKLAEATAAVHARLERVPIPDVPWLGPCHDPWLQSWSLCSPLVMTGLVIASSNTSADRFLDAADLHEAILKATESELGVASQSATVLANRLGL